MGWAPSLASLGPSEGKTLRTDTYYRERGEIIREKHVASPLPAFSNDSKFFIAPSLSDSHLCHAANSSSNPVKTASSAARPFLRQLPTVPVVVATSAHEDGNARLLAAGADVACPKGRFEDISAALARAVTAKGRAAQGVAP